MAKNSLSFLSDTALLLFWELIEIEIARRKMNMESGKIL
jgi:hypothetical protein